MGEKRAPDLHDSHAIPDSGPGHPGAEALSGLGDQCLRVKCFHPRPVGQGVGPVLGNRPDITATKGLDIVCA